MLALPLRGSTPELYHGKYIAGMFGSGEQGAWYDPSDRTTLYQDAAGTTPVTAVEQPVGLILDKSKGLVLGAELIPDPTFSGWADPSVPDGWTRTGTHNATNYMQSRSGGLRIVSDGTYVCITVGGLTVGRSYEVKFDVTASVSGAGGVLMGAGTDKIVSAVGAYKIVMVANSTYFDVKRYTACDITFDNISVRELPGNHATQATTASRPVLSARVNLLTKTEQFNDAVWSKTNATIAANTVVAPDGTTTADTFIPGAGTVFGLIGGIYYSSSNYFSQGVSVAAATYKYRLRVKDAGYDMAQLRVAGVPALDAGNQAVTRVLLSNGAVLTKSGTGNLTNVTAACARTDDGWCDIILTFTSGAAQTLYFGIWVWNTTAITSDGVKGLHIWGADLRVANESASLPAYQRVNTSTDYDTQGFPYYLSFDGVDDYLSTGSINFTATDKMTVFAGVRKLTDTASGVFVELSADSPTTAGSFVLLSPSSSGANSYRFFSRGSIAPASSPGNGVFAAAPDTSTITCISNISGPEQTLRRNAGLVESSTASQGTGNYGNFPLYIGRRNGASLPFKGHLYGLIVRGAATDDLHLTHAEKYLAYKSGVSL